MSEVKISQGTVDIRDACFERLYEIAAMDPRVILLTDDMGAISLERFRNCLSRQYFNMGIAEQNLIAVSAGLAMAGKIPFLYGISSFTSMRCYEQIRVDLCYMALPVTIIASGPGFTYGSDGPTHHATQDVAILRALPAMTLYNPSDASMTARCVELAYASSSPVYLRIEKGALPSIYPEDHDFSQGFEMLQRGRDLMLISTGSMVHRALEVSEELGKSGLDIGVLDLYRVKPIDEERLVAALEGAERLVTLEEHLRIGGIGSVVGEVMIDRGLLKPMLRLGLPDDHTCRYGSRQWLQARHGLDLHSVTQRLLTWLDPSLDEA